MQLILRSANSSREGGDWNVDDFDVFDGDRVVGRVYRVNSPRRNLVLGRIVPSDQPEELRARGLAQ